MEISVLIVDDHEVVRLGLRTLLERQKGFTVVGEADSGQRALALMETLKPNLVLMDVRMPGMSGIEACRELLRRWPETRVIMLTSYPDDHAAVAAVMCGAAGYLLKHVAGEELIRSLVTVARGGSVVDPMLTRHMFAQFRTQLDKPDPEAALNGTERKMLALIGEGKTNKEIASELFLGEKTVRNYVSRLLTKLNLSNRAAAAAYAARRHLQGGQK